jgi:hypothetical protein
LWVFSEWIILYRSEALPWNELAWWGMWDIQRTWGEVRYTNRIS